MGALAATLVLVRCCGRMTKDFGFSFGIEDLGRGELPRRSDIRKMECWPLVFDCKKSQLELHDERVVDRGGAGEGGHRRETARGREKRRSRERRNRSRLPWGLHVRGTLFMNRCICCGGT